MEKKKLAYFHMGFAVLLAVVVLILVRGSLREAADIVLPEMPADSSGADGDGSQNGVNVISVTPSTVQAAISTLDRPVAYQRRQTVETFWSSGSGKSVSQVSVSGSYTRIDTPLVDSSVSHMLISGGTAAVWYDEETEWTTLRTAQFTADIAQRMLTYERVLDLPTENITEADYREYEGVHCIYVADAENEEGYSEKFWVSVHSGLLIAAERYHRGQLIYRFTASEPETEEPDGNLFLLPDGSTLVS